LAKMAIESIATHLVCDANSRRLRVSLLEASFIAGLFA
jgi:hypothetical protein